MSGSLSPDEIKHFKDEGYVIKKAVFDPERDIDPIIREYEGILDRLVDQLLAAGEISSRYDDLPFGKRLIQVQSDVGRTLIQHFEFSLPQRSAIKADTPIWVGEAVFHALSNPRLLDIVESLIGPEIFVSPIHHVRMKLPDSEISQNFRSDIQVDKTPWHQDNGVTTEDADATNMITVWFPLFDAPISSGPLRIVPRSHLTGLKDHCPDKNGVIAIPEKLIDGLPVLELPMKCGDVLLFHKLIAHSSLPNLSDTIRWSFDLRYLPIGQPSGRDAFPGFVARSRKAPQTELHDPKAWAESWFETRTRLTGAPPAKPFNRWSSKNPVCA